MSGVIRVSDWHVPDSIAVIVVQLSDIISGLIHDLFCYHL